MRLYLDTNASSYLYERDGWAGSTLSELRRAFARECEAGRIELVLSTSLIEELAGLAGKDMQRYVRTITFLLDLSDHRFLLPHNERIKAEVAADSALTGRASFLKSAMRRELRSHIMGNAFMKEVADAVYGEVDAYKKDGPQ